MDIPTEMVVAAVTAAGAALVNNVYRLSKISSSLGTHIDVEEIRDAAFKKELKKIKKKLPNGEVEQIYQMVKELHNCQQERRQRRAFKKAQGD